MHTVTLQAFPHPRLERLERVVHKHNSRLTHPERKALLHAVEAGQPQIVARYVDEHAALNAATELRALGATAVVGEAAATARTEAS